MTTNKQTTDQDGFDFMINAGREEQDRDMIGILLATAITVVITACQYLGLL